MEAQDFQGRSQLADLGTDGAREIGLPQIQATKLGQVVETVGKRSADAGEVQPQMFQIRELANRRRDGAL